MTENQNRRTQWFDGAYGIEFPWQTSSPTPKEAQALIDQALRALDVDPKAVTNASGWRVIGMGSATALINIIQVDFGDYMLVVWSPLLDLPADPRLQLPLFEMLLRFNHHRTGLARFALQEDLVVLSAVRPIHGLDIDEVLEAIRTVLEIADQVDEQLHELFDVEMPGIPLDSTAWQVTYDLQRQCPSHTQHIFRLLLEAWVARKGVVTTSSTHLVLAGKTTGNHLAAFIPVASAGPLLTVSWAGLKQHGVLPEDIEAFQKAVPRPAKFKTTASTAHLPVDESFSEDMVEPLVSALMLLDEAYTRAIPPEPEPTPDLHAKWGLDLAVGKATTRNIDAVLEASPEPVQKAYLRLIQGWATAGYPIYTNNPGLIYLRLTTGQSTFALCTLRAPQNARPARIDVLLQPARVLPPTGNASDAETALLGIAGIAPHGSMFRISMADALTEEEAGRLLQRLLDLAAERLAASE